MYELTIKHRYLDDAILAVAKKHWPWVHQYRNSDLTVPLDGAADGIAALLPLLEDRKAKWAKEAVRTLKGFAALQAALVDGKGDTLGNMVPTSVANLRGQILGFIVTRKDAWLWSMHDGVTLPWLVVSVEYNPPRRDIADSTTIKLQAEIRGSVVERSISFHYSDLAKKQPLVDVLAADNLYVGNPGVMLDYEYDMELYDSYADGIGKQYWATGWANKASVDDATASQDEDRYWWRSWSDTEYQLDPMGVPSKVVVDVDAETGKRTTRRGKSAANPPANIFHTDLDIDIDLPEDLSTLEVRRPVHPYLVIFDLARHCRARVYVRNLEPYVYDATIGQNLILPKEQRQVIDTLTSVDPSKFSDIVANKSGGVVMICQGPPGTGKTLTAEIIAEQQGRAMYTVQCSQLGLDVDTLEKNLVIALNRASRWGAVMLLDEADVYVQSRGQSIEQNAIVGVFLRVLEYHAGTLFLTTNRLDSIDDAIVSRAVAVLRYDNPVAAARHDIWRQLLKANNVEVSDQELTALSEIDLSGRNIKNSLKLALLMGQPVTAATITGLQQYMGK